MLVTYEVFSQTSDFEGVPVTQYGILCKNENSAIVNKIEQIGTEQDRVIRIAALMCEQQLDPVHCLDVIEDFLDDPTDKMWR